MFLPMFVTSRTMMMKATLNQMELVELIPARLCSLSWTPVVGQYRQNLVCAAILWPRLDTAVALPRAQPPIFKIYTNNYSDQYPSTRMYHNCLIKMSYKKTHSNDFYMCFQVILFSKKNCFICIRSITLLTISTYFIDEDGEK